MKFLIIKRSIYLVALALAFLMTVSTAMANGNQRFATILDKLVQTDGAQAVVAAVLVVDEAEVLEFSLAEILGNKRGDVVLFAPGNAAFEKLLGLEPGTLNGLTIEEIVAALPGLLPPGVDAGTVAAILLKHVSLPRRANLRTASENALLENGSVVVADESVFAVGIGATGVQINYETTIIKANIKARNGVIHYIDTVIVDDLL
ncbi:fasciclin domain-containing protein [Desulfosediminicola sp.]|uniref:fasciclin domain-containing protein n=1 Tax=Desulfosediminicola sp. TaxID=2886825 RepID=UPI003AF2C335